MEKGYLIFELKKCLESIMRADNIMQQYICGRQQVFTPKRV